MPKTILIAEDYADTRNFIKFVLENEGYEVIEATNGNEAVDKFKKARPDLVLIDISLPVMDGLSAARIIRKFQGDAKMPIIAVTAHGQSFYKKAIEAGCDDLISKPVTFNTLQPIVNLYLKSAEADA